MIELRDVWAGYESGTEVLRGANLKVADGEWVLLTGESGVGKTTLIRLLTRELKASRGSVLVNGKDLGELPDGKVPVYRQSIGVVFQDFRLLENRNVYENLELVRHVYSLGKKETERKIISVLSLLGIRNLFKRMPDQLSGGEKQKVCLARAIMNNPKLLLADEPTGNLDPESSAEIMKLFDLIHRQGTTVIVASHDHDAAYGSRFRECRIEDGRISDIPPENPPQESP
ncbi:MAG: ATP-binding cassette domain-containing protein [Lachnospiraceae bacterium]|nr:ATP-binding cassette domain-containing protein [Lachnospiraceae bacterium]